MRRPVLAAALLLALPASAADHAGDAFGTWSAADNPHRVLGTVRVPPGARLDIEPGCVVVFAAAAHLQVVGTLGAAGTPSLPIAFASMGAGSPGEWKGIALLGEGPHVMTWCDVSSATTGIAIGPGTTLQLADSSVAGCSGDAVTFANGSFGTLSRCGFAGNGGSGVALRDSSPTLDACRFAGNARAAWLSGDSFPRVSGLFATGNSEGDGIIVDTLQPITAPGRWFAGGIPYVVPDGGSLVIEPLADVFLSPGVTVKMGLGARIVVEGALTSLGLPDARCRLTSLRDDTVAGDTNRDGAGSEPAKGDWDAVEVAPGGLLRLQGAVVSHADDAVRATGGDVTLYDCDIRQAGWRGLAVGPLASAFVLGTSFTDCETGLQVADASRVLATSSTPGSGGNNAFTCNVMYDVQNLGPAMLSVREAWFGPYGPDPMRLSGEVDAGLGLGAEPGRIDARRVLALSRPDAAQVTFRWEAGGSCATYRLGMSELPGGSFATLSRSPDSTLTTPLASLPSAPVLYFELEAEVGTPVSNP